MNNGLIVLAVVLTVFVIALWQGQEASIRNQENIKEKCQTYGYYTPWKLEICNSELENCNKNYSGVINDLNVYKRLCK